MTTKELLGLGAAACAACCIGPFLVAVGVVASLGVLGSLFVGAAALAAAGLALALLVAWRHRRSRRRSSTPVAVEVGPTRR